MSKIPHELKHLDKKSLQQIARQYKIKNFKRKSPSALKRAIRRYEERLAEKYSALKGTLNSQEAAIEAYRERRLRYLFSPSRFVHTGVHEEYLLEKPEELKLPQVYLEDQLVVMPIDPYHFYAYWDFSTESFNTVQNHFPVCPFSLRIYDITDLVFNGMNAHDFEDETCHPLIREWYVDVTDLFRGRHICVELGYEIQNQFVPLLRSNTIAIPSDTLSSVVHDVFGAFVPIQQLPTSIEKSWQALPTLETPEPDPSTLGQLFFQVYAPPLIQKRPQLEFPRIPAPSFSVKPPDRHGTLPQQEPVPVETNKNEPSHTSLPLNVPSGFRRPLNAVVGESHSIPVHYQESVEEETWREDAQLQPPGASERKRRRAPGGSEHRFQFQPLGASERHQKNRRGV